MGIWKVSFASEFRNFQLLAVQQKMVDQHSRVATEITVYVCVLQKYMARDDLHSKL